MPLFHNIYIKLIVVGSVIDVQNLIYRTFHFLRAETNDHLNFFFLINHLVSSIRCQKLVCVPKTEMMSSSVLLCSQPKDTQSTVTGEPQNQKRFLFVLFVFLLLKPMN